MCALMDVKGCLNTAGEHGKQQDQCFDPSNSGPIRQQALFHAEAALDHAGDLKGEVRSGSWKRRIFSDQIVELSKHGKVSPKKISELSCVLIFDLSIRLVLERLDGCSEIGIWLLQQVRDHESGSPKDYDVRSPVGKLLVDTHLGDAADRARAGELRSTVAWGEPESAIALQTVRQHAFVAGLKDVER
jgi:hypothetical protein